MGVYASSMSDKLLSGIILSAIALFGSYSLGYTIAEHAQTTKISSLTSQLKQSNTSLTNAQLDIDDLNTTILDLKDTNDDLAADAGTIQPAVLAPPTVCTDGTTSWSTGSGTCSWHGGIDHSN
jgi:hypothetical protein